MEEENRIADNLLCKKDLQSNGLPEKDCYISHKSEEGLEGYIRYELVKDHLNEVAEMASSFGRAFHAGDWAYVIGLVHDIGKYSKQFQKRILYEGPKCDHSTAGAWELCQTIGIPLLSYCVAGHHSGLPNGGTIADVAGGSTLSSRLAKGKEGLIPNYDAFKKEVDLPRIKETLRSPICDPSFNKEGFADDFFPLSFLIRMLFSCLVDADYLCTECFVKGASRKSLSSEKLDDLLKKLENKIKTFYPAKTPINRIRCDVLDMCKKVSSESSGVFSLTVPTGGGKTYASLYFALLHACRTNNDMQRIIYAIPYTSIIEQNAKVFREVLGENNVLEHHSNFDFDALDDGEEELLRLASENWDSPLVVTTNVQFFESLFSNRTSKCRKLHNIANSVIILDEAQMIPTNYLKPCVRVLSELVTRYGCTVLLCTATQPSLNGLFKDCRCEVKEIISNPEELYDKLKRVSYLHEGYLSDDDLAKKLASEKQVLCVVNSRKQALKIFHLLKEEYKCDFVYHLSTLMHPTHRERVLEEIRSNLAQGKPCRVVSTSLIEAGVDVDFPTVFRSLAGLDNVIQCAGRCNREGKKNPEVSIVHVFESSDKYVFPRDVANKIGITRSVLYATDGENVSKAYEDGIPAICSLDSLELIEKYFDQLHCSRENGVKDGLDSFGVLSALTEKSDFYKIPSIPFKDASEKFQLIEEGSFPIVVPDPVIAEDISAITQGYYLRGTTRRMMRYTVNVYKNDLEILKQVGALDCLYDGMFILVDTSLYSKEVGLDVGKAGGKAFYF